MLPANACGTRRSHFGLPLAFGSLGAIALVSALIGVFPNRTPQVTERLAFVAKVGHAASPSIPARPPPVTVWNRRANVTNAVKQMYEMLDEHGMDFVVRFSRACYEVGRDLKDLKYLEACIAYHYFAHGFDAGFVKALHEKDWHEYSIQTDPFLTVDSVDANARAALRAIAPTPGFDYDAFIAEVKKEANAAVRRLYGDERKMTPTEGVNTAVG